MPISMRRPNATLSQVGPRCDSVATAPRAGRRRIGENQEVQVGKPGSGRSDSPPRVRAALSVLRTQHERVTRARQAVIEVLDSTEEHLAADEIVARAEASAPGVHRATV